MTWYEALAFFLIGAIGGGAFTFLFAKDSLEKKADEYVRQTLANKKKIQLERNGRGLPRREDAAPGASRVHKITTRRNQR